MDEFCRESQQTAPLVVTWVLLSIAIAVTVTRIFLRFHVFKTAGWDDYTAIAGLVRTTHITTFARTENKIC